MTKTIPVLVIEDNRLLRDGIAAMLYASGALQVFLDGSQTPTLSVNVDLTNISGGNIPDSIGAAWMGLTAATGSSCENHDIFGWAFTSDLSVVQPSYCGSDRLVGRIRRPDGFQMAITDLALVPSGSRESVQR